MCQVNIANGEFCYPATDFLLPGPIPIKFARYYSSQSKHSGPMGIRWEYSLECSILITESQMHLCSFTSPPVGVPRIGIGTQLVHPPDALEDLIIERQSACFIVTTPTQLVLRFDLAQQHGNRVPLTEVKDCFGNLVRLGYRSNGMLDTLEDGVGRALRFNYREPGVLTEVILRRDQGVNS